ncbi:MAG TPA: histidine phosphatase family protein [Mycobacteriales bacterium]|nr:histidine phosphatase family protein [Mycobacteriales bacterium]
MINRTLVLIRHAKAEPTADSDTLRPLAPRGRRDAEAAGRWLADLAVSPGLALVSTAVRAQQTWEGIAGAFPSAPMRSEPRIYDNTVEALLAIISEVPDEVESLVLVGHNPSMHGLAITLDDGDGHEAAQAALHDGYPTCAITVFDVACGWSDLAYGAARIRAFAAPRADRS